jgi:probable rRNA maturation factor
MIYLNINESLELSFPGSLLENTARSVLEELSTDKEAEITIAIEDDEQLRELNQQFLGIDAPTDVLSFPSNEVDPDTGNIYLGDIIISLPAAIQQAGIAGHPIENEMQLLVIHGMLHLLGFDHDSAETKMEMWAIQARFLDKLGIEIKKLPED